MAMSPKVEYKLVETRETHTHINICLVKVCWQLVQLLVCDWEYAVKVIP